MNAALRENRSRVSNFSEHVTTDMSWHRGRRQFGELRVSDAVFRRGVGDKNVQARSEDDGDIGLPFAQPIEGSVAHAQAAEIGGAVSGLRVPAITSGCNVSSRIGVILESCFGYAIRVWSTVIKVNRKRSAMRLRSDSVKSHSVSCPSAM